MLKLTSFLRTWSPLPATTVSEFLMSLVVSPIVSGNLYSNLVEVLTVCRSFAFVLNFLMVSTNAHLIDDTVMAPNLHSLNRWSTASSISLRLSCFLGETR
jgi:hypothetical protein